jgi:hypothetical protein
MALERWIATATLVIADNRHCDALARGAAGHKRRSGNDKTSLRARLRAAGSPRQV